MFFGIASVSGLEPKPTVIDLAGVLRALDPFHAAHGHDVGAAGGGFAPSAERTVGSARMFAESLTPSPGIREHYRREADIRRSVRSEKCRCLAGTTILKGAKNYSGPKLSKTILSFSSSDQRRWAHIHHFEPLGTALFTVHKETVRNTSLN